jgi:uncharacterized protein
VRWWGRSVNKIIIYLLPDSNKFVKHPKEIVKTGDIVNVRILNVDIERGRISLSMKDI